MYLKDILRYNDSYHKFNSVQLFAEAQFE